MPLFIKQEDHFMDKDKDNLNSSLMKTQLEDQGREYLTLFWMYH